MDPNEGETDIRLPAMGSVPLRSGRGRRPVRARIRAATASGRWRTGVRIAAPAVGALLLVSMVLGSLGLHAWTGFGLAAAPVAGSRDAQDVRGPLATPAPAPTIAPRPTASPNVKRDAAMGCVGGAPNAAATAIFSAKDYATGGRAPNEIALTFDDGPTPATTPPILDYLERTHTPATFFVMGEYAQRWPELVQREWRGGFAIGVHTWNHPSMPLVGDGLMAHEFGDTLAAVHAAIGADACIWFWRPPYGDSDGRVTGFAQRYGLTTIQWDDDPRDWSLPGSEVIAHTLLAEARPGSIVVMHDGPAHREQTAAALPLILAGLRARGLAPVTIPRLLADCHYPGVAMALDPRRPPPDTPAGA